MQFSNWISQTRKKQATNKCLYILPLTDGFPVLISLLSPFSAFSSSVKSDFCKPGAFISPPTICCQQKGAEWLLSKGQDETLMR